MKTDGTVRHHILGAIAAHALAACGGGGSDVGPTPLPRVGFASAQAQPLEQCATADPLSVLAGLGFGDFEVQADPQDPAGNVLYVANAQSGASRVVIARIDGHTGDVIAGSLVEIADNFNGQTHTNGPEFVQKPTGEMGVIYAGDGGVHGVFRSSNPTAWNKFAFDVNGSPTHGSPPVLPGTSPGAYPGGNPPLGQNTYEQILGDCSGDRGCFGALGFGVPTDVASVLSAQGLAFSGAAQSPRDGYIFISACDQAKVCGLYEARIDNAGAFMAGSFRKLARTAKPSTYNIVATRHPVTGTTVLFAEEGGTTVDVWEQSADGSAFKLIASVAAAHKKHFQAESDRTKVVLNYWGGVNQAGNYTMPVTAKKGKLQVGAIARIGDHGYGTELQWLPALDKWAVFLNPAVVPDRTFMRCWVAP